MGACTSDNRHNECSNIRGIIVKKWVWKILSAFKEKFSDSSVPR
jgi:hypothetical protein